jgi:hypothetical protein
MLQASVPNISSVFRTHVASVFICMLYMFHTYIARVLSRYCICLQWFPSVSLCVFLQVFQKACFECFTCLQMYVAVVASECFKSRSGVAHRISVGNGMVDVRAARAPHERAKTQARAEPCWRKHGASSAGARA